MKRQVRVFMDFLLPKILKKGPGRLWTRQDEWCGIDFFTGRLNLSTRTLCFKWPNRPVEKRSSGFFKSLDNYYEVG
jgi:hypothetical protein